MPSSILITGSTLSSYVVIAEDNIVMENNTMVPYENPKEDKYLETRDEISLDGMEIKESKKTGDLVLSMEEGLTKKEEVKIEKNIDELEFLSERYGDAFDDFLISEAESSENNNMDFVGISYTECPLKLTEDGNWDRIEKDETSKVNGEVKKASAISWGNVRKGETEPKGTNFLLGTAIKRSKTKNKLGEYIYLCSTTAFWKTNPLLGGGYNFPDAGDDSIYQTTPAGLVRTSEKLNLYYTRNQVPVSGTHYSKSAKTNSKVISYSIQDDPYGWGQMTKCQLIATYKGKTSNKQRQSFSYYFHTWTETSFTPAVTFSAGLPQLTITPSVKDKSWNVSTSITFRE